MRIIQTLVMTTILALPVWAQTVSVPISKLTEQQKREFVGGSVTEQASSWIGFGHEVGVAFNEGLGAVTDNVDKFGATRVGSFIMVVIAWRMIGLELMKIFVALFVWITTLAVLIWSYRKTCMTRSVLSEVLPDKTKKFTIIKADDGDVDARRIVHAVVLSGMTIVCGVLAFAG